MTILSVKNTGELKELIDEYGKDAKVASIIEGRKVRDKLNSRCNEEQTYLEFIRESEKEFGFEELDVFSITLDQLEEYIDFLGYLWEK